MGIFVGPDAIAHMWETIREYHFWRNGEVVGDIEVNVCIPIAFWRHSPVRGSNCRCVVQYGRTRSAKETWWTLHGTKQEVRWGI